MSNKPAPPPGSRPSLFRNGLTVAGLIIALGGLFSFALLFILDTIGRVASPYIGLLTYIIAPGFLLFGLFLAFLGLYLERRRHGGGGSWMPDISLDLARPRDRRVLGVILGGGLLFLMLSAIGSYHTYHFTESVQFCGQICHQVMQPELVTYQHGAHARVSCTECHIGSGATWFVRSKLSGTYQLYATAFEKYPRPVPTPVKNLRPAQETCEQCHWPQKFSGDIVRTYRHFLSDETNTEYSVSLMLRVGGGDPRHGHVGGIHWHVANKVEYLATDEQRLVIPWVRHTDTNGHVIEYRAKGFTNAVNPADIRRMDCVDCHNRPAHRYQTPNDAVDQALAAGALDRSLPFMRSNATWVLVQPYATEAEALDKIGAHFLAAYPASKPAAEAAATTVRALYQRNFFPVMKASWKSYPEHIGHKDWPGCFRCHDDKHQSADGGRTIQFTDCDNCHTVLWQGQGKPQAGLTPAGQLFKHPVEDYDTAYLCNDCHTGGP